MLFLWEPTLGARVLGPCVLTGDCVEAIDPGVIKFCGDVGSTLSLLGEMSGTIGSCNCVGSTPEVFWMAEALALRRALSVGSAASAAPSDAVPELERSISTLSMFISIKWHYLSAFPLSSSNGLLLLVT